MKIANVTDGVYASAIQHYLQVQHPSTATTSEDKMEVVFEHLMGTKQVRNGPKPSPEGQVAIRNVVREAIEKFMPIPVLMPWGSRKPDVRRIIDVAELSTMKTIMCLQESIQRVYEPGFDIRMRLEDTSGFHMFQDEGQELRDHSTRYVEDMRQLVHILDMDKFLSPVKESQLMSEDEFWNRADIYTDVFRRYLNWSDYYVERNEPIPEHYLEPLKEIGFRGEISLAQRDYYRNMYMRANPLMTREEANHKLGMYMGGVVARRDFKATGEDEAWGGKYLKFYFGNPIPGVPRGLADTTMHYRTILERYSRNHLAPWRGVGYLRINEEGDVTPAIASPKEVPALTQSEVTLTSGVFKVILDTSYQIL